MSNGSSIRSDTRGNQDGEALSIQALQLSLKDGSLISASTLGAGRGGDIRVTADSIEAVGIGATGQTPTGIVSVVGSTGAAGNVTITTRQLSLREGGQINTSTLGAGRGGDINVTTDSIEAVGLGSIASVADSTGAAGNITVTTRQLSLQEGGRINTSTFGAGRGGDISVTADSIEAVGIDATGRTPSNIQSGAYSTGAAGNVTVTTQQLSLREVGNINTSTVGAGRGGDISVTADSIEAVSLGSIASTASSTGAVGNVTVTTRQLSLREGGIISTTTAGEGQGGTLSVTARESADLVGSARLANGQSVFSGLFSGTEGTGASGSLRFEGGRLSIREGGRIEASTNDAGRGGDISVKADSIEAVGIDATGQAGSGILSVSRSTGTPGNITVTTRQLSLREGGNINTSTFGAGRGGTLSVIARESTDLASSARLASGQPASSGLLSITKGTGAAGSLRFEGGRLSIGEGGVINASSGSSGRGGDINVTADLIEAVGLGGIASVAGSLGAAGNVTVTTRQLSLREGGQINTSTAGAGRGGDISVKADSIEAVDLGGIASAALSTGTAGNIIVTTQQLSLQERGFINTSTFGTGRGGNIFLNTVDLTLSNSDLTLSSSDRAAISAESKGKGDAGDIHITATGTLRSENSPISTMANAASGGNITITGDRIRLRGDGDILTQVDQGRGSGGNININANSLIAFDDSDIIAAAAAGRGGNINLGETIAFFENFDPNDATANPKTLQGNGRADVNATGAQPGIISIFDTTFIQNSLSNLPETVIDTDRLIANSCIARTASGSTFLVVGSGGLPPGPGGLPLSPYPAGTVRTEPDEAQPHSWRPGDAIVEPQGVYQLPNGELIMSRECH